MNELWKTLLHLNTVLSNLPQLLLVSLTSQHIFNLGGILTGLCVTLGCFVKWKACN